MATVFERVRRIILRKRRWGDEKSYLVTPRTKLLDLGFDSLELVKLFMDVEEEFSSRHNWVEIDDDDVDKFVTLQDVVDHLKDIGVEDNDEPLKPLPRPKERKRIRWLAFLGF